MSIVVPAAPTTIVGQVLNNAANVVANNVNRLTGVAAAVAAPGPSANQLQAALNVQHEAARQSVNNAAAAARQSPSSVSATDAAVLKQVVNHADALYQVASENIAALRATGSLADAQTATDMTIAAEQALNNVIAASDQIASGRGSYGRLSSSADDDDIFDEAYFDTPARRYREKRYKKSAESRSVTSTRRQNRTAAPKRKAAPKKKKSYPSASQSPTPRKSTAQKKKPAAARSVTTRAQTVSVRGTPVRRRRAYN